MRHKIAVRIKSKLSRNEKWKSVINLIIIGSLLSLRKSVESINDKRFSDLVVQYGKLAIEHCAFVLILGLILALFLYSITYLLNNSSKYLKVLNLVSISFRPLIFGLLFATLFQYLAFTFFFIDIYSSGLFEIIIQTMILVYLLLSLRIMIIGYSILNHKLLKIYSALIICGCFVLSYIVAFYTLKII